MKPVTSNDALRRVAKRVVWFKTPDETLGDPSFFLAYVMTYGMPCDLRLVRQYFSDDNLRQALSKAPPGVFDPRSWSYWHVVLGLEPVPPLPVRKLPETPLSELLKS
jgi:hypothetical protein